ncbi:MAG: hypothetical protein R2879_22480 [Saprospiraceae bacterium]
MKTVKYWGRYHGYVSKEEQQLIKEMVGKQSNQYLKWALKELSNWKEPTIQHHHKLVQIHGTKDKVFPVKLIREPFIKVQGASHFMVYKQAQLLSEIISRELSQP